MEPPVSVPSAAGIRPAAMPAADPLEEPPEKRARSQGLRAGGQGRSKDGPPCAHSCVDSLPSSTAPACASLAIAVASVGGTTSA
jgi:hypothetical protein